MIGTTQATEVVKLLLGVGRPLVGRLLILDALEMSWREVSLRRNPDCPVCGDQPTQTELIDYEVFCGVADVDDAGVASAAATGSVPVGTVAVPRLLARLEAHDQLFLLDVREDWEWSVGNLADRGARLVPLGQLESRLAEVPRDRPIVVYCKSGQRSELAARLLMERGYSDVVNLEGGLVAWAELVASDLPVA
jgi:adenylyltransferase/sulfurtransferase